MVHLTFSLASLLAVGTTVLAVPAPQLAPPPNTSAVQTIAAAVVTAKPTTTAVAVAAATVTTVSVAAGSDSSSTEKISIPDSAIENAPLQDNQPLNASLVSITVLDNSTLVEARPDLQEHVDVANNNTVALAKRGLSLDNIHLRKRVENPNDCNPSTAPELTKDTWKKAATRVCNAWYPDPNSYKYDPSAPLPTTLKSTTIGPINVGGGVIVTLKFSYGVDDWGTQASGGWQKFYVPQGRDICIADLWTLIEDMELACFFLSGYHTDGDFTGTEQPKWYKFTVS